MYPFKNILFVARGKGVEGSLGRAVRLARRAEAKLTVVDAIEPLSTLEKLATTAVMPAAELQEHRRLKCRTKLAGLVETVGVSDFPIETLVLEGRPFLEVIRDVLRHDRDLVIKPNQQSHPLGSEDMHLLRKCPCPVWVTREADSDRYSNIMAAIDVGERGEANARLNDEILEIALYLAGKDESTLHIVSAWHFMHEADAARGSFDISAINRELESARRAQLDSVLAKHACPVGRTELHLIQGFAHEVVTEAARASNIDVLVMGSVGRVGIPGFFMGNTAETILNQVSCSVLTLKPPGFRSPVTLD